MKYFLAEELLLMGGMFYTLGGNSWCDTPTDSYQLIPGMGYLRRDEESPPDLVELNRLGSGEFLRQVCQQYENPPAVRLDCPEELRR